MPPENEYTETTAVILDENSQLTLRELCIACALSAEQIMALMEEGVIEPHGSTDPLRFSGICVQRVRRVVRLERDLGVNHAGAALALELLEEIEQLRARIRRLERR
ncbi:chaperone modulator CbpM [Microbulbifer hydrolyticus]|uniref:Chaperone modulatory protein CbpM n=1 Tax=Microbulbifer hydrolyticus TaxID=48074 RepID=A0A6P1TAD4_9GAMM|nr:chaperone modulator CbpM [Microbulbifer hydrolyticus]MBB5212042.1 chaperone modulatory protein CbpM [Microbulbifer hydrolyticus]QHQ39724.1 MerR family transcriptional regulator [Microbulbifer hydrolyticus]